MEVFGPHIFGPKIWWTLTLCLVGVKIGRMKNKGRKIGWKTLFSTVWQKKENVEDGKPGKNFSLPGPQFSSSQIRRKIVERKVLSQHFYRNALIAINTTATNTIIFLSNISKLKHNQIIRIQIQKHNFKINQIITIKAKKKKKKNDRRQKPFDPSGLRWRRRWATAPAGPTNLGRRWPI